GRLHAERLEADVFGVRGDSHRNNGMAEPMIGTLAVARLDPGRDSLRVGREAFDTGAGQNRKTLFLHTFLKLSTDLGVLDGNNPVEHLDDGHLRTKVGKETGELDPDRA